MRILGQIVLNCVFNYTMRLVLNKDSLTESLHLSLRKHAQKNTHFIKITSSKTNYENYISILLCFAREIIFLQCMGK